MTSWPVVCRAHLERLTVLAAVAMALLVGEALASESLNVPQELMPAKSEQVLSRQRRFVLPQSSGWSFGVTFKLAIPLQDLSTSMAITVPFTYKFDTGVVTGRRSSGRGFLSDTQRQREQIIKMAEQTLTTYGQGLDGHSCVLRLLCEMAEVPVHTDGILGDAFSLLLTPSHIMDQLSSFMSSDDYLLAQKVGRYNQDCSRYHAKCPHSVFQYLNPDHPDYQYPGYFMSSDSDSLDGWSMPFNQSYPEQRLNEIEPSQ